jgi:G3E family GTPase
MTFAADGRIPLIVVTGFLGSGKTSLIRHLLADRQFASAVVIVNEFGQIGIDHHLFLKTEERITLLRDGCACCARRDDLVASLLDLVRSRDRPDRDAPTFDPVLLETSGLADPGPILHTVMTDPILSRRYRVEMSLATVDAVSGEATIAGYAEAVRQITAADLIVITKRDLVTPEVSASLEDHIARLNPTATLLRADHGRIDVERLWDGAVNVSSLTVKAGGAAEISVPRHGSSGQVKSLALSFATPLDWGAFGLWLTMLLHRHGDRVLRVKGLLDVGTAGPLLVEGVQHVVHAPRHLPAWPDGDSRSRLVVIARELEPDLIRESLVAFQGLTSATG